MKKVSEREKTAREYARFIKKANTGNVTIIKEEGRYEFLINGIACELCGCTKIYGDGFFDDSPDGAIWTCSNCWIEVGFSGKAFPINRYESHDERWVERFGYEPDDWPFKKPSKSWAEWTSGIDAAFLTRGIKSDLYEHFQNTGRSFFVVDWLNGMVPEEAVAEHVLILPVYDPNNPF